MFGVDGLFFDFGFLDLLSFLLSPSVVSLLFEITCGKRVRQPIRIKGERT